jgi:hypothetical protein
VKRVVVGDIIEIPVNNSRCYAHFVYDKPRWGQLLWFYFKLYDHKPREIIATVDGSPDLISLFPLKGSLRAGLTSIVGHRDLDQVRAKFPVFRSGVANPKSGKVDNWWLWNGDREWRVGALTPEQMSFPYRGIINRAFLIDVIEGRERIG